MVLPSASVAQTTGLVAAYAFSEGSGTTTADASGHGNTGTISNATWTTAGKYGNALVFNGTNALVTVANSASLQLTSAMTLEAWVNPSTVDANWRDVVYKANDNYYLEATSNIGPPGAGGTFGTADNAYYATSSLAKSAWTHIAVTYDGASVKIYVNGAQVTSAAQTGSLLTSTNALTIGGDKIYGQYFAGTIDEVRIYSTALTASQIQTDMTTPISNDTQPPTAPGTPTATAVSSSQINLSWTASTDNVGVTGYIVQRCQGAGCNNFAQIATTSGTTYSDTGLSANTTYCYRVQATDAAGNLSAFSGAGSATTPALDTQPPTAPGTPSVTAASATQLNLSWTASTDNVGVTGYIIQRCQGAGCTNFAQIATTTGTTYGDTGLSPATTYSYRLQATDAAGNLSSYSGVGTGTTQADTQAPTAPTNLTATAISASQVSLAWGASTDNIGVTGYLIERCQGAGCSNFAQIATTTATTYTDSNLSTATSYSYRVRATDAAGNLSAYSNTATATTTSTVTGLVAAYAFNEGAGTTVSDSSGNGNNGTISNATWTASGKYGNALVFNGTNAQVSAPDSSSQHLSTAMTLEAWVNPSTVNSSWRDIIYKPSDSYYLEGTSDTSGFPAGGGTFGTADVQAYGTSTLPLNTWTHVAVTYDGSAVRLYINGTLVSTRSQTGNIIAPSGALQIGGDTLYGQYFAGTIDEVRVYSIALTATQVQSDMTTPIGSANTLPAVNLSTTSLVFPNQNTGTSSSAQTVTMANTGGATLSISGITISPAINFTQTNNCGTSLAAGKNCAINVTFSPTSAGTLTATLSIADNAPNTPQTVALSGTGVSPGGISISPRATVITSRQTAQFTVSNGGTNPIWSVDGVQGGSSTTGTISTNGLYTPPSTTGSHTVTVSTSNLSQSANATVYVSNYPGTFTHHNDNYRTGQNTNETVLTPANVNSAQFGKLASYPLDGIAYASPLYVANVNVSGKGLHNVVYVATEHDSLYAFDADASGGSPLWQVSFINPGAGITTIPASDTGETGDIPVEVGITGTPVVDTSSGTLYLVAATKEVSGNTTNYVQRLHAIDITSGAEKFGGPVVIQASVPGSGDGASGGKVPFDALRENQRTGLMLYSGVVYFAFGSHGDVRPWHGWVLGYNASTLQQTVVYNASPNSYGAGIWHSGGGIACDSSGYLYFATSNGPFDVNTGGVDYGDSVMKLSAAGGVLDYFTPDDQANMDANNLDFGSAGPVLLLDPSSGPFPHILITAGKSGSIYVINRDNLGHYSSTTNNVVQTLPYVLPNGNQEIGNFSSPVYFNNYVYFGAALDNLKAFQFTNGSLSTAPVSQTAVTFPVRGAAFAASANGASNGILWAVQNNDVTTPGVLFAYDATNLAKEFWDSNQAGTRDQMDPAAKFNIPLVANGKVFVATNASFFVYGLLP